MGRDSQETVQGEGYEYATVTRYSSAVDRDKHKREETDKVTPVKVRSQVDHLHRVD